MARRLVRACFFFLKQEIWREGWSVGWQKERGCFRMGRRDWDGGRLYAWFCTRYDIPMFTKMEKKL